MDESNTQQTAPLPRPPNRRFAMRRFGAGARLVAGLAVIAVVAGGSLLGVALSSGSGQRPTGAALAANTAGSSGRTATSTNGDHAGSAAKQGGSPGGAAWLGPRARRVGARLRACLASARQLSASGHRAAARLRLRACIRRYVRLRLGLAEVRLRRLRVLIHRADHGQITIQTKNGPRTLAFERGAVQSASANSLVVRALDGTTWTWVVGSATRVVKAGQRVGAAALAVGQRVVVLGVLSSGSDQARRVLIIG